MVRAGKVEHPREWRWCGYDELMGMRQRYRILDIGSLLQRLDGVDAESFRAAYAAGIDEHIERQRLARETAWTEGLAVGSRPFAERVARETGRVQLSYAELPSSGGSEGWCVREFSETAYAAESSPKTVAKTPTGDLVPQ